mmetsp:Transcript_55657/g.180636  ORF Transcript_55657/g.180636 Transcript_55657/m.180636 type:complete len:240 (+) Transcript_55657:2567-3286(+)
MHYPPNPRGAGCGLPARPASLRAGPESESGSEAEAEAEGPSSELPPRAPKWRRMRRRRPRAGEPWQRLRPMGQTPGPRPRPRRCLSALRPPRPTPRWHRARRRRTRWAAVVRRPSARLLRPRRTRRRTHARLSVGCSWPSARLLHGLPCRRPPLQLRQGLAPQRGRRPARLRRCQPCVLHVVLQERRPLEREGPHAPRRRTATSRHAPSRDSLGGFCANDWARAARTSSRVPWSPFSTV